MLIRFFVSLCFLATGVLANKVLVFFKPGAPDTLAPALILKKALDAKMVPHGTTFVEAMAHGGYKQAFSFDTYTPADAMDHLSTMGEDTKLILYVKRDDHGYDNIACSEINHVDFALGSYLIPVMKRFEMPITEGATLLDKGLSLKPDHDGRKMRELWSVKECSEHVLYEIIEATPEQIKALLAQGGSFLEKLDSMVSYMARGATIETFAENNLRIGFQISTVGITGLAPAMLASHPIDIAIILSGLTIDGTHKYSIWAREGFSGGKVAELIRTSFPGAEGGGTDRAAGATGKMRPDEVFAILKTRPLSAFQK